MKKRNTTIFAFLLLAAVGMGVGYAAISQEFKVGGDITVDVDKANEELEAEVYFSEVKKQEKCTVTIDSSDKHKASIDVNGLELRGETATGTLVIKNDFELPVNVQDIQFTENTNKTEFTVAYTLSNETIAAGQTVELTFTIKLNVVPTEQLTDSFGLTFNVVADYNA